MMTVAEFFARELAAAGVERVYGLPGGENVEILEALRRQGIDFLLVKSESSACFMAATAARLTGKIGVALTTLGPGATNAYAGFAHAYLDRAPVLLITAASDPVLRGRHSHQVLDLPAVFAPISKLTAELSAKNAAATIRQALAIAKAGRPGPVHLSLHNRIALQQIEPATAAAAPATKNIDWAQAMADIQACLDSKKKPIIVVGLGLEPEAPYAQLRAFAEALGAPVIDSPKSKGALAAEHPLFAGTVGLTRTDPVYALLDEADCIIAIGFDVVELVKPWDYKKPLIWLANWANDAPRLPCAVEYVGNIGGLVAALGNQKYPAAAGWGVERIKKFRAAQAAIRPPRPTPKRILPHAFLRALRENTADDIIVCTDVGSHKIFSALQWPARRPNRYFVSNGLSAMGFGLSSAIAAAQITGQPTVCITGDAGLAMALGELGLLLERPLPLLILVMNDAALDLIRSAQRRGGHAAFGTEFRNPDYAAIARAYGLAYQKVETEAACAAAIRVGLAAAAPMLIDVMIDPIGYPTTVA